MKVYALNASPRKGWNCDRLLDRFIEGVKDTAPIYYSEVPSQMRALIERLFHPGDAPHEVPVSMIYTMNQPEDVSELRFRPHTDRIAGTFRSQFHTEPDEYYACFTLHWQNPEDYKWPLELYERKVEYKEKQWPVDLQNCCDAGVRFAGRVRDAANRRNAAE